MRDAPVQTGNDAVDKLLRVIYDRVQDPNETAGSRRKRSRRSRRIQAKMVDRPGFGGRVGGRVPRP